MAEINYLFVAIAAFVSIASPGPATLAIMAASMNQGRRYGVSLALGVLTGSLFWSSAAAFGLGTVMQTNMWTLDMIRVAGAAYLLFLSYRSIRSAVKPVDATITYTAVKKLRLAYLKGVLIHLTNPKAILFFGALYSLIIGGEADTLALSSIIFFVGVISASIFLSYAMLFSSEVVRHCYVKSKRYFEVAFGALFGIAGLRLLLSRFDA